MKTKAEKKPAYEEALRYLANAEEYYRKAGDNYGSFKDVKYVQTGAGVAYNGVLIALDEYLRRKEGAAFKRPKSIEEYRTRVSRQNKTMLKWLNTAYSELHLHGYYMGTLSKESIRLGMDVARKIINHIKE